MIACCTQVAPGALGAFDQLLLEAWPSSTRIVSKKFS
jgi:hypothetical protein